MWDDCRVRVEEYCYDYDGHTSAEVLNRLSKL